LTALGLKECAVFLRGFDRGLAEGRGIKR
jgi:hypothetical protein